MLLYLFQYVPPSLPASGVQTFIQKYSFELPNTTVWHTHACSIHTNNDVLNVVSNGLESCRKTLSVNVQFHRYVFQLYSTSSLLRGDVLRVLLQHFYCNYSRIGAFILFLSQYNNMCMNRDQWTSLPAAAPAIFDEDGPHSEDYCLVNPMHSARTNAQYRSSTMTT